MITYEDDFIKINLSDKPSAKGHLQVISKNSSAKNLEDLSVDEAHHLFFGASYAATALFELIGAHGTNIILTDGDGPLVVDVIARNDNDGLNFLWSPTQGNPAELDDAAKAINDAADTIAWALKNPDEAKKANGSTSSNSAQVLKADENGDENYLLKSLRRIP